MAVPYSQFSNTLGPRLQFWLCCVSFCLFVHPVGHFKVENQPPYQAKGHRMVSIHNQGGSHTSQLLHKWLKVRQDLLYIGYHLGALHSWPQVVWLQKKDIKQTVLPRPLQIYCKHVFLTPVSIDSELCKCFTKVANIEQSNKQQPNPGFACEKEVWQCMVV